MLDNKHYLEFLSRDVGNKRLAVWLRRDNDYQRKLSAGREGRRFATVQRVGYTQNCELVGGYWGGRCGRNGSCAGSWSATNLWT